MKINKEYLPEIRRLYEKELLSCTDIGEMYGVSRQNVLYHLKKMGADTSNRGVVEVECWLCGKRFKRKRSHAGQGWSKTFCSWRCGFEVYRSKGGPYYTNKRKSNVAARAAVKEWFPWLKDEHDVHHEDRQWWHNHRDNLMIFASHKDHARWHYQEDTGEDLGVKPIWRGDGQ